MMRVRRRNGRVITGSVLMAAVLAAGAFLFWYRATYNVMPGQGASTRVHWCGRDYEWAGGGTSTWAQLTAQTPGHPRLVGRYPPLGSRAALYAAARPASQREVTGRGLCAMGVYLQTGPDRYRGYALEGGP
jgi:hypothetical protein